MERLHLHPTGVDCQQLVELVPEYCLGTASPSEMALIEANLHLCPELADELAHYQAVTDGLLHSAPLRQAPTTLKTDVLAKIRATPAAVIETPAPIQKPALMEQKSTLLEWLPRRAWGLVAALLILLIGTNIFWAVRALSDEENNNVPPAPDEIVRAGNLAWIELVGRDENDPLAYCIWSRNSGQGVLVVENLPVLPDDQTYQVWARRDSENVSLGLVHVGEDGKGVLVLPQYAFREIESINVTYEPYGGSEWPTGRSVAWSHDWSEDERQ